MAITSGANVKAVQKMLDHASASMTPDRYGHLLGDELDAIAERLGTAARVALGHSVPEATVTAITRESHA